MALRLQGCLQGGVKGPKTRDTGGALGKRSLPELPGLPAGGSKTVGIGKLVKNETTKVLLIVHRNRILSNDGIMVFFFFD